MKILELARWAPSGDNTQPWSFEILDDTHVRIYGSDTRDKILYDYDGHPSHMAHGALLETIRIAASNFGLRSNWIITSGHDGRNPIYEVNFDVDPSVTPDPLFSSIKTRTVQRRPMKTVPLTVIQRQALIDAAGDNFSLQLFESSTERLRIAKLLWQSAKIRLTCPEAYPVHKDVIEWHARYSKNRIPEQAIGVDPLTARLMEWVMQSWERVRFFNRYLLGTIAPRIQLDLLPGFYCACHLLVRPKKSMLKLEDWLELGGAVQRIWLTIAHHGLYLQPQMTPVIFRWYARADRKFSSVPNLFLQAVDISKTFEEISGASREENFAFFARVGASNLPRSRSIRKDLSELVK